MNGVKRRFFGAVLAWWLCAAVAVCARADGVTLRIEPEHVGLVGVVRPGDWTPLLLTLGNPSASPRRVRCEWVVPDGDGDLVVAQRVVTLTPHRDAQAWLYTVPPFSTDTKSVWRVRVIDEDQGQELAAESVGPMHLLDTHTRAIGITGARSLGLEFHESNVVRHEGSRLVRGIEPGRLPDRWYGLSSLQALIWTADGGDPGSAGISIQTHRAIRQWVQRGGHLIVVPGVVGDDWSRSPLSDLLAPIKLAKAEAGVAPRWLVNRVGGENWLGSPVQREKLMIYMRAVEPIDGAEGRVSILLRDGGGRPIVAAWPFGLGRVTCIGVDLTEPSVVRAGMPNGGGLWSAVFGWRGPAYAKSYLEEETRQRRMSGAQFRRHVELDRFVAHLIAMRDTATPALLAAIVVFGAYWLAAGPVGFGFLKKRGRVKNSWAVFLAVVVVFSLISWGGAWVVRPGRTTVSHFTVLDGDGDSGLVRVRSWLSLFVPKHGQVEVAVGGGDDRDKVNTLASPGLDRSGGGEFLDQRLYSIDAGKSNRAVVAMRATAKQFEINYLGRRGEGGSSSDAWSMPRGRLRVVDSWPRGTLTHGLPGGLRNVLIVYCPGDGRVPRVWRRREAWEPGQVMTVAPPEQYDLLVGPVRYDDKGNRDWNREGYLGRLIAYRTGQSWGDEESDQTVVAQSEIVGAVEMLGFYDSLPPPDYRNTDPMARAVNYDRTLARDLDVTARTQLRGLLIMGHLERAALPAPVTVDGMEVDSSGWTVVRWFGTFDE